MTTAARASRQPRPTDNAAAGRVQVTLLDAFELSCDGTTVRLPLSVQRLVAFVAMHPRPVLRPYVAGSLWPDTLDDRASANLRSGLWRLHRTGLNVVEASDQHLRLQADVRVDLRAAEALARRALDDGCPDALDVDPWALAHDLLPDWYDDWVLIERERFRQFRLQALDALCERLIGAGRLRDALEAGLWSMAGEPLRESAHRALIRVHLADGNAAEAIRQYGFCRRLLRERLGIEPSDRMKDLIRLVDDPETER